MTNKIDKIQMPDGQVLELNGGSGLELCDIGMALYVDETKGLRRYLNGQIVDINANTQAFLNRLLEIKNTNPDYFATEENWQSEALLNIDGCVYKFVLNYSGETVVSVRLPKYPDYVEINAGGTLPVVGNGLCLGITNGTGTAGFYHYQANTAYVNVETRRYGTPVGGSVSNDSGTLYGGLGITTDGTKSGIQTTLKQTKLKMRYFIQIATGSETENNIINEIELNNPFSLFDSKYSDHELNNLSWLKSNGQWNAKAVYPTAYDKLLKVYNGMETVEGLSVKLSTETYTDYDFVLNTAEETFRLPLLDGSEDLPSDRYDNLELLSSGSTYTAPANGWLNLWAVMPTPGYIKFDNTSGLLIEDRVYNSGLAGSLCMPCKKNDTVIFSYDGTITNNQFKFTYAQGNGSLYFYVGETVQNANLIDAGRIGEQLANKQDKCIHIIDTYVNGNSWYRVYSDGWCEQGGYSPANTTVSLLKPYKNIFYYANFMPMSSDNGIMNGNFYINNKTVSSFKVIGSWSCTWQTSGYIA